MLKLDTTLDEDTLERARGLMAAGKYDDLDAAVQAVFRGESQRREGMSDPEFQADIQRILDQALARETPPQRDEAAVEEWRRKLRGCLGDRTLEDVMDELRGRGRSW